MKSSLRMASFGVKRVYQAASSAENIAFDYSFAASFLLDLSSRFGNVASEPTLLSYRKPAKDTTAGTTLIPS